MDVTLVVGMVEALFISNFLLLVCFFREWWKTDRHEHVRRLTRFNALASSMLWLGRKSCRRTQTGWETFRIVGAVYERTNLADPAKRAAQTAPTDGHNLSIKPDAQQ